MTPFRKRRLFLFLAGAIVLLALVLLAASIERLELKPAVPFSPAGEEEETTEPLAARPPDILFWYLILIIIAVLTIGTILALFFLPPKQRRRLILTLLFLTFLLILTALLISRQGEAIAVPTASPAPATEAPAEVAAPQAEEEPPPSEFVAPAISPWLSFAAAFLLFAVVVFLSWRFLRRWGGEEEHVIVLEQIARQALEDLQAGRDYGDTVIECYARMTEAVRERRGIKRREHMTASEFAAALERARLPGEAVRHLTRLFEAARYGGRSSTPQDIAEAMESLTAIIDSCQEAR